MKTHFSLRLIAAALLLPALSFASVYPPDAGTDRDSATYLEATEKYLQTLDLNDPELEFKRLGGTTATNWSVKKDGTVVADLKCTSGNTDHHGAVIAYRLGRELGFDIYPVAVYREVDLDIDGFEINQQCALKEWESVFTQYYWTRDTFTETDSRHKRNLVDALRCENPKPQRDAPFQFSAKSAYGDPTFQGVRRVPYHGDTNLLEASRDFSNMMVVDTLIGNEDRFPGGNTFFRSVTTSYTGDRNGVTFENVRLYSLDNEAAFKAQSAGSTHSARDLKKHVWRFDRDMMAGLQRLAKDPEALDRISDGNDTLTAFIRDGIRLVLDQYAAAQATCGEDAATF